MFSVVRDLGVTGRAHKQNLWSLAVWNPRDFTHDVHRTVDDRPYGGGPGMVMMAEPLEQAVNAAKAAAIAASTPAEPRSGRSEEHTSELQSLMRISYAVFCLKKKTKKNK